MTDPRAHRFERLDDVLIAVATTGSPNTPPHSRTERFEVIRIDPFS